jgi:hypothetical protein
VRALLGAGLLILLSGCWTLPSADVRPAGEPRVIAGALEVVGVAKSAKVESVDPSGRILELSVSGASMYYGINGRVRNWSDLHPGERVSAKLREVLTVYVMRQTEKSGPPDARVIDADPSYRLLRLQYANGATATFKVALHASMQGISAGDAVKIHPVEVLAVHHRHSIAAMTMVQ